MPLPRGATTGTRNAWGVMALLPAGLMVVIRYVEASPADIELADRLAPEVLGQSLDELPPGTRRLLDALHGYVTARCRAGGLLAHLDRVGLEYTIAAVACVFSWRRMVCQATIWYSFVSPPRICFRRIRCSARLIGSGGWVPA